MWTGVATFGSEVARSATEFGAIVVVGGGCYGSYYVRQLGRARAAGTVRWREILVVDRNPACSLAGALASAGERAPGVRVVTAEWSAFFARYLDVACAEPAAVGTDAIVPSPLMPHLMSDWLKGRAEARWPGRSVGSRPLSGTVPVPWQRGGAGDTHYVSFAEWQCPVNCVEPAVCPHTRETRWWTMPSALDDYVAAEGKAGRPLAGPVIFHCTHRAYGVGMFDTMAAVRADAAVEKAGTEGAADVLVGTVSHCHGALNVLAIGGARGNDC